MAKLRKLRIVLHAAEAGRISEAAQRMHMSQPAASRAILALEEELGVALFRRSVAGLRPTEAGRVLSERIRRALLHFSVAERALCPPETAQRQPLFGQAADHEFFALIAIAETGTISGAARREGISQPALTRSLRLLETRLGQALFHRTSDGMRLNLAGEAVVRRAKLAYGELRAGLEEVATMRGQGTGLVRIGALPLTRARLVPYAVDGVLRRYPEARVSVIDGTYQALIASLRHGDIDGIVGTIRDPAPADDVVSMPLFSDAMVIVGRAGHPLADRRSVALADCLRHDWVLPFPGVPLRVQFEALLDRRGLPRPRHAVEVDSLAVVRTMLLRSERLAIVSRHQVHYETLIGQLVLMPIDLSEAVRPVGWTVRRDYVPTPVLRAFEEELRRVVPEIAETPGLQQLEMAREET